MLAGVSTLEKSEHGQLRVVNCQDAALPSGVPSAAFAEPEIVTVYVVPSANGDDGVRVAVRVVSLYETTPATGPPELLTVIVEDVRVVASIDREKVACTGAPRATDAACEAGDVAVTVGGAGGVAAVVNVHDTGEPSETVPSLDRIDEASVAVYVFASPSGADGVNTTRLVAPT